MQSGANEILLTITVVIILISGTAIGLFTRELIYPSKKGFLYYLGLSMLSGFVAFGIKLYLTDLSVPLTFLLCVVL